ncbi:MAG TPA: CDP-alcohol phosphatidyltransferase family protein [Candidatus Binatia bacterium]|jgi:phosphatidylglycerophosphate synthase|nr:CDP-alcohol phosphatidyltransferase family protein [Candidatus Binatia bacterium]
MIEEHHRFDRVVILSDESANWQIAGLRQLDRLVLGLDEFAKATGTANKIEIVVFWKPEIPLSERLLPKHQRITRVRLTEASGSVEPEARILATRLFIARNALSRFFPTTPPVKIEQRIVDLTEAWPRLFEQFERTCRSATRAEEEHWRFLAQPSEIVASEKHLLRHIGKSQDGMVSRFLNRPISRVITRLLLKLPITPNAWTMLTFALAPVAFVFLVRGDYTGFLVGSALFQLMNILDGCDGEIARAKYLDSERGRRLDAFCDFVANLIFVLCLGIGLFRQPSVSANIRFVYLLESLIAFFILAGGLGRKLMALLARDSKRVVWRRQEDFNLAERFFGRALTAFIYQITQRDVIYFVFLLLAIAGRASWILHIFFAFSVITLLFRLFRKSWRLAAEIHW